MGKVWHVSIPRSLEPINNVRSFLLILTPSLEDGEDVERATEAPDVNFEMAAPAGKYETGNGTRWRLDYEIGGIGRGDMRWCRLRSCC